MKHNFIAKSTIQFSWPGYKFTLANHSIQLVISKQRDKIWSSTPTMFLESWETISYSSIKQTSFPDFKKKMHLILKNAGYKYNPTFARELTAKPKNSFLD